VGSDYKPVDQQPLQRRMRIVRFKLRRSVRYVILTRLNSCQCASAQHRRPLNEFSMTSKLTASVRSRQCRWCKVWSHCSQNDQSPIFSNGNDIILYNSARLVASPEFGSSSLLAALGPPNQPSSYDSKNFEVVNAVPLLNFRRNLLTRLIGSTCI
jgi:hypothetical protein